MPAGDVFGLDGIFLTRSNPIVVSTIDVNPTSSSAGVAVTGGVLDVGTGTATLTFSSSAGLTTTPFFIGSKIAVSGLSTAGVAYTGYNGTFVVTGFADTTTVSYATTGYVGPVTAGITTDGLVVLVTDAQIANSILNIENTHGWIAGGQSTSGTVDQYSRVDRINFSNDLVSASIRQSLSSRRYQLSAVGNANYGWFGGGYTPGPIRLSSVERINYSNDLSYRSTRGPLNLPRSSPVSSSNSNYGWFGGGLISGPILTSRIERIDFSNDSSTSSIRSVLSASKYNLSATGNLNYGWYAGGVSTYPELTGTPRSSTIDRIDYSNDLLNASPRGKLTIAKTQLTAVANYNYGWFGGGYFGVPTPSHTTLERVDFSNDLSTTSIRGNILSPNARGAAGTSNSNYGWFSGSRFGVSQICRIDFSNDLTTASPRGPLSLSRGNSGSTSGQARSSSTKVTRTGTFGWFVNGNIPSIPVGGSSRVDRINFSNDSVTASVRAITASAGGGGAGTSNSEYGFVEVGVLDFSNDTVRFPSILNLNTGLNSSATGNSNYGWWAGGTPGIRDGVFRLDYSNYTAPTISRGPLSRGIFGAAATGNSNYGWFGGGFTTGPSMVQTIDRIDFSNDSMSSSPRGTLSIPNSYTGATGNSNYSWFGGGYIGPGPIRTSIVDRINFSNDTIKALSRGQLMSEKSQLSATGNSNYGWFGGGYILPGFTTVATVDRIDFSNDLLASTPRGALSQAKARPTAVSNTPIG